MLFALYMNKQILYNADSTKYCSQKKQKQFTDETSIYIWVFVVEKCRTKKMCVLELLMYI